MSDDLKTLHADLSSAWEDMKGELESKEAQIAKIGEETAETKQYIDRVNARMDEIEKAMQRPEFTKTDDADSDGDEYRKAFVEYARTGSRAAKETLAELQKGLSRGVATAGGFLVPENMDTELIRDIVEFSPWREFAKVSKISQGDALTMNVRTSAAAATWVSELGTRSETTNPAYGQKRIPVHEMTARVDVSQQVLEDAAYDLEAELRAEFAEQFGVLEGAALTDGNGVGRPEGVLSNADVDYSIGGHASTVIGDGLITIYHDLKDQYARAGVWFMERATLKIVRQLKDSVNGQYLWTPAFGITLQGSEPATILGRPYRTAENMPSVGADAYPIVFGDVNKAVRIVDRVDMQMVRDDLTLAEGGEVKFVARRRVGGQVVLAEAIRKLKIATS
jgi:HK97 family phage major capsid protein